MLKPQDILILLKLSTPFADRPWRQLDLALALELSQAEVHNALQRCEASGLYLSKQKVVQRQALLELLVHGVRYVFPASLGEPVRGIPTAWAASPLDAHLTRREDLVPVWPWPEGTVRGTRISPLYDTIPAAIQHDPILYELLALLDGIRLGGARERNLAAKLLEERLSR